MQDLKATDGATVHGRLLSKGKPVANAQLMMLTLNRASGDTYSPMYIGTDEKGRFSITNVPAGRVWSLDANSDSLKPAGTVVTKYVETHSDGETVNVGDMEVREGHSISGRVVLSDGKPIPADMRITFSTDTGGGRSAVLPTDGKFELDGLSGPYLVIPAVRGYRLARGRALEALVDRDLDGFVITLDPAPPPLVPQAPLQQ